MMRLVSCLALAIFLLASGCEKLPEEKLDERGDSAYVRMASEDAIPASWGRLVSVSNSADFGHIFQLWFEDTEGNVRVAFYNIRSNVFQTEGRLIPRSEEGTP